MVTKFNDLIGNEGSLLLLQRALARKTLSNFVIFEGMGGTGKSTSALLTAMSLTCENQQDGNPCMCCKSCRAIASLPPGTSSTMNFSRVNIPTKTTDRDFDSLLNEIFVLQSSNGNCVYVLEEAHAIKDINSQEKLLDKIDHMPENVYILMTTTEMHKLIDPLKSRAVSFSFSRLNHSSASLLFDEECKKRNVKLSAQQKELILKEGRGVPRDIIKLLDLVISNDVTYDELRAYLKETVDKRSFIELFTTLSEVNTFSSIEIIEELLQNNSVSIIVQQLKEFILDVIYYLEGGIKGTYTQQELEMFSIIFKDKPIYQIATLLEKLNKYSSEEDIKFLFIKIRNIMQKGNTSAIITDNKAKAKHQSIVNNSFRKEKDFIEHTQQNTAPAEDKLTKDIFLEQAASLKGMNLF